MGGLNDDASVVVSERTAMLTESNPEALEFLLCRHGDLILPVPSPIGNARLAEVLCGFPAWAESFAWRGKAFTAVNVADGAGWRSRRGDSGMRTIRLALVAWRVRRECR